MKRSTKLGLLLISAGAGGLVVTYLLLRRNRERIDRAADATREMANQADRVATTLEGVRKALGAVPQESRGETEE